MFQSHASRLYTSATCGLASLQSIQVLLFIGYYQLFMLDDASGAANSIDAAVKQALKLDYHQKPDAPGSEIECRTFFSCCVLDCYMSLIAPNFRPILLARVNLRLPCSNTAFMYSQQVKTRTLHESIKERHVGENVREVYSSIEYDEDEDLGCFIRTLHCLAKLINWVRGQELRHVHPQPLQRYGTNIIELDA
jgi:hypothetical protein